MKKRAAIVRLTTWIAGAIGLAVTIILPAGYFAVSYQYLAGSLETEAEVNSRAVSALVSVNPDLWQFEQVRLQELLGRRLRSSIAETQMIVDLQGAVIARSNEMVPSPGIRRSYRIMDSGLHVATLVIGRSLRPLLVRTALLALLGLSLGLTVFIALRVLPLRAVDRAERELRRHAVDMQSSNEELKAFIYSVSHDLRAPLVNVKGFSVELANSMNELDTVLKEGGAGLETELRKRLARIFEVDVKEALRYIAMSVDRMDGLINALLKLSRMGRRDLRFEKVDAGPLVRSLVETFTHQIESRGVVVTIGALPLVVADRVSLEQIMGNLIDNALKYLHTGRAGTIEIIAERSSSETVFHVRDNGRGIAKDDVTKVFEIFRRAGTQNIPGEGMGLAYVKALVRRHGGRIWCESELGVGTTFSFTIPRMNEGAA